MKKLVLLITLFAVLAGAGVITAAPNSPDVEWTFVVMRDDPHWKIWEAERNGEYVGTIGVKWDRDAEHWFYDELVDCFHGCPYAVELDMWAYETIAELNANHPVYNAFVPLVSN